MWESGDITSIQKMERCKETKTGNMHCLSLELVLLSPKPRMELVVLWDSSSLLLTSSSHITRVVDKLFPEFSARLCCVQYIHMLIVSDTQAA